jgi:hypothetical protein
MFSRLHPARLADDTIDELVGLLHGVSGRNFDIPAGYTYLGQYIDHDITFDPTSKLRADFDRKALVDFRTPRFDLDSLYGSGSADQPFLYDWSAPSSGAKLLVGCNVGDGSATLDLPRNEQGRALIGDARNDENIIISQLHLLFIRFHNAVVDHLRTQKPPLTGAALFEKAQRLVRWHYQWIVVHDFLERIVGRAMARRVLRPARGGRGPTVVCEFYKWRSRPEPFIPLEFSAAAYRFGHSMVRDSYALNDDTEDGVPIFADGDHPGELEHLGGFRRLPVGLTIDWGRFYALPGDKRTQRSGIERPQPSRLIDTDIASRLSSLPASMSAEGHELARRNLLRGRVLRLPSGVAVARAMRARHLTEHELLPRPVSSGAAHRAILRAPPLWYYILCEAASELGHRGQHLGPVGGQIVAEVLVGLLEADPSSYLHASSPWKPELPRAKPGTFTMPDLVELAVGTSRR